ncbi:DUF805 domain-containing protein [Erythrobacter sp. THAF29]|uniref:DUF805 domain-containing protein n=1 Tax=Erythrobacter sp. THAF29 TaxID=2587851 RepID=UPI0012AA6255|nr:DUF805 domain-containing protein [Erythrobacter sp. THAF29]QFT76177.1 hypothetical protein FIU90_01345 [Erythrobacter sp. THAF29]
MFVESLKHGYSNLLNFTGRDMRDQFWPFALFNVALALLVWLPFFAIEFIASFTRMRDFAEANPDKATIESGPGRFSITIHEHVPGLGPDFDTMLLPLAFVVPVLIALLAAAVARRLHDTGRRGWIGLVPAIIFLTAMFVMREVFSDVEQGARSDLFFAAFGLNLAANASLVVLVVLLCTGSEPRENAFGPPPA